MFIQYKMGAKIYDSPIQYLGGKTCFSIVLELYLNDSIQLLFIQWGGGYFVLIELILPRTADK